MSLETAADDIVARKTTSDASSKSTASTATGTKRKVLKRVKKTKEKGLESSEKGTSDSTSGPGAINFGADVFRTLTSSRLYFALVLLRFVLIFFTPASLEGTEFSDGVDTLAASLLPGMASQGSDPLLYAAPEGMGEVNRTRSIVGAFVTSGIPYMAVNVWCTKLSSCAVESIGYYALYAPRVWMFFISLFTDVLLVRCFAVYEGEHAVYALLTYASTWTTLIGMTRNMNFSLEALCVIAIIAGCFGWKPNVARPVFWLSAMGLSLGIFLRPAFVFFVFPPIIYLTSLSGKQGIQPLRFVRGALEGIAIFGFWCTIWVSVDSIYYGTFKLRFGGIEMESFDMFLEYCTQGLPFSYKGKLVYAPLNAFRTVANRKFLSTVMHNTSPGQMFLSLPAILGPLFIVLLRESYEGTKVAMKELMADLKQVANSKKAKKKKSKKAGMTKELEEEIYVYFDTIQTTFLLGLLIEVAQNHDRLGTLSLMSLIPPCIICIAGRVFGPESFPKMRSLHIAFTVAMVLFYGVLNQSGIPRVLLQAGAGKVDVIPQNADLVVYRGIVGHRAMLGPNVKNISVHSGGESLVTLMTKVREIKNVEGYNQSNLLVMAAATVPMKDTDFELVGNGAWGHMSSSDLPSNFDDAVRKSSLMLYRFIGDEDEAIIRDSEEAAEKEEREREEKLGNGRKSSSGPVDDEL